MAKIVLIVDDNPDEILLTKKLLSRIDPSLEAEGVTSGETALEFLNSSTALPSLILLDLKIPGMDGIEILRNIRTSERLRNIPVVIFTSSTLEDDEEAARAAGANDILHKGISLSGYKGDLSRLLQHLVK